MAEHSLTCRNREGGKRGQNLKEEAACNSSNMKGGGEKKHDRDLSSLSSSGPGREEVV